MFRKNLARVMVVLVLLGQLSTGVVLADPEVVIPEADIPIDNPVQIAEPPLFTTPSATEIIEAEIPSQPQAPVMEEDPVISAEPDRSVVVDSQEIDLTDPLVSEKYFVVQYEDGAIETRKVEQPEGLGIMDADQDPVAIESQMAVFEQKDYVEIVEPLIVRRITDAQIEVGPNDPGYTSNSLWGYSAIHADDLSAWVYAKGLPSVTIAILDTGMDMDHPDLAPSLASVNRGDGTMVKGYDAVGTVLSVAPAAPTAIADMDYSPDDGHGHGTHVSGTAAAIANNGIGIAGVAGGVKILPVKVLDNEGYGTTADVIEGIDWAVTHGADVISMSLGSATASVLEQEAINRAHAAGVIVVAATGNDSNNWSSGPADITLPHYALGEAIEAKPVSYPAACDYVIGVGSVGLHEGVITLSDFSNSGPQVDVVAPGEAIYSTVPNDSYSTLSGTSMATPHVAGLAGLVLAENPDFTPSQVESAIKGTAHMITVGSLYGGNAQYYGAGIMDAYNSISTHRNNDATLDNILINSGAISFVPATTGYTITVDYDTTILGIKPIADNALQVVTINGDPYDGSDYKNIDLNAGSNLISIHVTARDTTTVRTYTLKVVRPYHTLLDSGTPSVSLAGKVPSDSVILDIPEAVLNPNVAATTMTTGGNITSTLPAITANRTISGMGVVKMQIPNDTEVSALASSGWAGIIGLPTVKLTASTAPDSGSVNSVIEMGAANTTLTFSKAVRLLLPGMGGKSVGYISSGLFHPITTTLSADTQAVGNALTGGTEGKITVGTDLVVWTKHFTEFVVYTPATSSISSGGGGGSSGVEVIVKPGSESQMETDTIKVAFPPNSYSSEFQASMNPVGYSRSPFNANQRLIGKVFALYKNIKPELDKPMAITFAVKLKDLDLEKERLALFYLESKANVWKELPGTQLDPVKGTITGSSKLFTEYATLAVLKEEQAPVIVPVIPVLPTAPSTISFTDMAGHWAADQVNALVSKKAIAGYPDSSFRPDAPITRGEFVTVLVKAQGLSGSKDLPFSDLEGHWAKEAIRASYANGVVAGLSDGLFHPDDPITREQMAVMVDRTLRYISESAQPNLKDQADVSPWAAGAIERMITFKVMAGYPDGAFKPKSLATRAEAVAVILKTVTN